MTLRRIDAHQHYWSVARTDYGWLTPATGVLYRDYQPADLAPHLARHGITGTIIVQAAPTIAETEYLLAIAEGNPSVLGVVGWVDLLDPAAPETLRRLTAHPKFKGVRPMLQDLPEDDWIANPALDPAIRAMIDLGLSFDALVYPRHLPPLLAFARRHPGLQIVIDHLAKPFIAKGEREPWASDIWALAELVNVFCKISGMATEAGPDWTVDALAPYVDHVIRAFGSSRVMWGSDWPVLLLAGDYDGWVAATDSLLAGLSDDQRDAILYRTAEQFYRL